MSDYQSNLTKSQQVDELNAHIKAKLAPSKIHGVGVVALRNVHKGEKLYADILPRVYNLTDLSKLFPEIKELILERWPSVINGGAFISPDARLLTFMNHSETPSYDPVTDELLTDIKAGEEITEDYRTMDNWQKVFPWL